MNKYIGYLQIGFAVLLYILSVIIFIDYMYSLTIPDTVTAVENAFGKLVILIFMLVMAKFSRSSGKKRLLEENGKATSTDHPGSGNSTDSAQVNSGREEELDPGQEDERKGADN